MIFIGTMPARNLSRKKTKPRASRPSRGVTKFPGSSVFAKEANVNHSHLYRVLLGQRESQSLINRYAVWLRKNNMAWPAAAAVKPKAA